MLVYKIVNVKIAKKHFKSTECIMKIYLYFTNIYSDLNIKLLLFS